MLPQAIDVELNCLLDEPSHGSPREAPRRFLDDHSAIHAVCCRIKAPLRIVMPDGRCAKPSAMAVGCNGAAPFAADHTPSSTTAVPLPESSAKRIDEAVQGRVRACSTFDVHVLHDVLGELDAAEPGHDAGGADGLEQLVLVAATVALLVWRVANAGPANRLLAKESLPMVLLRCGGRVVCGRGDKASDRP